MPCRRPVWLSDALALYASQPSFPPKKPRKGKSVRWGCHHRKVDVLEQKNRDRESCFQFCLFVYDTVGSFVLHACLLAGGPCCLCAPSKPVHAQESLLPSSGLAGPWPSCTVISHIHHLFSYFPSGSTCRKSFPFGWLVHPIGQQDTSSTATLCMPMNDQSGLTMRLITDNVLCNGFGPCWGSGVPAAG
jgi:hypothetical protein